MGELSPRGSKYSDEQRKEAAVLYTIKGSMRHVSDAMGIPQRTLHDWKGTDWWDEVSNEVRSENDNLFKSRYSEIIDKATRITIEKLDDVSAKDAAVIAAVAQDKLRLLCNQPSRITANADSMASLAQAFEKLALQHQEKIANAIEGQCEVIREDNSTD